MGPVGGSLLRRRKAGERVAMAEPTVVVCPNCMQKYRVPLEHVGKRAVCKQCGERFKISVTPELDDDTICGWIAEADPGGTSVMGSTSIFAPPPGQDATTRRRPRPSPPTSPRVRFVRVDRKGATFEFAPELLDDADFRWSFPERCIHCLNPMDLSVHLLIWGDKLPRGDALRLQEDEVHTARHLDRLVARDPDGWFEKLEPIAMLPPRFRNPFPYYVCRECSAIGEVRCQVEARDGTEHCQVTVANLTVALDFYRNNGGRGEPGYQRLLVARRQQKDNQWENLPYAVRARVSSWYTRQTDEKFLGFYADEDFSKADAGAAGLVLTDQRLVFKKYSACRDYPLRLGGRIFIEATKARATIEIAQDGKEDAVCSARPLAAGALARSLDEMSKGWDITVNAAES